MPYCKLNLNLMSFFSLTSLQLLMFLISLVKTNLSAWSKWPISEGKMGIFHGVKKKGDLFFLQDICFSIFIDQEIFSYIEKELKTIFRIIEGFFK